MEKIYRVQMNKNGMPNFATAEEVADRPKGEWREEQNWRTASFYSVCSECGYFDDERDDLTAYNFCPYCGAEMKGADDEAD